MLVQGLIVAALMPLAPASGGVRFENCVHGSDGSITCDTVPTGNTLWAEEAARFGLLRDATPGWNEFLPDQGAEEELGDIED